MAKITPKFTKFTKLVTFETRAEARKFVRRNRTNLTLRVRPKYEWRVEVKSV